MTRPSAPRMVLAKLDNATSLVVGGPVGGRHDTAPGPSDGTRPDSGH